MDRNITPMNGGEQASFKETLILNLRRNKEISLQNVKFYQEKAELCDRVIDIVVNDGPASYFAEKMQELQAGIPQDR